MVGDSIQIRQAEPSDDAGAAALLYSAYTNASTQLNDGEQIHVVSGWLGHANPSTTLNVYAHLMPGAKESVRDRLEQTLGANSEKLA